MSPPLRKRDGTSVHNPDGSWFEMPAPDEAPVAPSELEHVVTSPSLTPSRAGLALGRKYLIRGIDFRFGLMEDCTLHGGLSYESYAPAP